MNGKRITISIKPKSGSGSESVPEPATDITKVKPKIQIKAKPTITPKQTISSGSGSEFPVPVDQIPETALSDLCISFDIGIINLAYCILYYINDRFRIVDWNIINMASGSPKLTCIEKIQSGAKKGKICGKKAHYMEGRKGYCAVHGRNRGYERNMTVDNVTEFELKCKLFRTLDGDKKFLKPKIILIETQPLKAREKIKGVSHSIFDYYVLRGVIDQGCLYDELKFIDAKNKLTIYEGPPMSCHLKTQYARNKWYAKEYCKWFLSEMQNPTLERYFTGFSKKDDLADCFLQGAWYLQYGRYGKKGPNRSSHQSVDDNIMLYPRTKPKMPTKKSMTTGHLTMANVKYLVNKNRGCFNPTGKLLYSIEYFFGDLDTFRDCVLKNV